MPTRRLAAALLISLLLSVIISGLTDRSNVGMLRRGDFPAFYAAARIVRDGKGAELYSRHLQQEVENASWPSLHGTYFAFAYPPFFALYLSPLAKFPPVSAKLIFLGVQLIFFAVAYSLLRIREKFFADYPTEGLACLLCFAPLFAGMVAGQGAALNLLLLLLAMGILEKGTRWEHDALLGVLFGIWLFKPQFSLIALGVGLAACQPVALFCGWLIGAVFAYLVGVLATGLNWPELWLEQIVNFAPADFATNGFQMVSLAAVSGELSALLGKGRAGGHTIGMLLSLVLLLIGFFFVLSKEDRRSFAARILGPALVLCGGHVLFYESGLLLPAFLSLVPRERKLAYFAAADLIAGLCCFVREWLPLQPLFLLGAFVFAGALLARSKSDSSYRKVAVPIAK